MQYLYTKKRNQKHKKIRKSLNFRFFLCNFCQGQSWTCIRKTYKTWNIFARNYKEKPIEKNEPPKGTSLTTISILIWIATVKYYYCGKFFPRSVSIQFKNLGNSRGLLDLSGYAIMIPSRSRLFRHICT